MTALDRDTLAHAILVATREADRRDPDSGFEWYDSANDMADAILAALPVLSGLDVERLAEAMRWQRFDSGDGDYTVVPPSPGEVAAEYDRLSR